MATPHSPKSSKPPGGGQAARSKSSSGRGVDGQHEQIVSEASHIVQPDVRCASHGSECPRVYTVHTWRFRGSSTNKTTFDTYEDAEAFLAETRARKTFKNGEECPPVLMARIESTRVPDKRVHYEEYVDLDGQRIDAGRWACAIWNSESDDGD